MQAMIERDRRYKLGAGGPRIEIDDAYIGGERTGEGAGRGRRGTVNLGEALRGDLGRGDESRVRHRAAARNLALVHLVAWIGRLASGAGRCRTTAPSLTLGLLPCRSKPRQPVAATFRSSGTG